ncbi:transcriptional regulator [Kitasatospora purpeofusca]|uniref:transcriptional regulator n=1 Tax=Kitasatospora purpeofusca TaxID=67352 RepID=UPI002253BEF8|nr:transcriptional regulator [Kitasatospora purpeofusca]MCX4752531.1 transcriptional regulator [Kitasatospora purpeofusca]WSR32101.1 transcriptional regulator [Kitasatospora purpeofusca]
MAKAVEVGQSIHPLTALLVRDGLSATRYLTRIDQAHQELGFGAMAVRREKLTRWTRKGVTPERPALLAMARYHGIDLADVDRYGWPDFLYLALHDDGVVLESPWTAAGTVLSLTDLGGHVDRRAFLITSTGALGAILAQWTTADPALALPTTGRRLGASDAQLFELRLNALRHLDDTVGSEQVYQGAVFELQMIRDRIKNATYTEETGRQLFAAAAEASRLAGWCAYDEGRHAAAERHFVTALRAAATAQDPTLGALVLGFWANLRYNAEKSDPRGALHLIDAAMSDRKKISSPRVRAMLHARAARAHSKAGESTAAYGHIDEALAAYESAEAIEADLPALYWLSRGEIHQVAASSALSLGEPRKALDHFTAAATQEDPYDTEREIRGTVIYEARRAEAHLALGELDAAVAIGHHVIDAMGGVDSARSTSTLGDLRTQLRRHRHVPTVAEFLSISA